MNQGTWPFPENHWWSLQTRGALRLEALLPEGLIDRVKMGEELNVTLDALLRTVKGRVTEMVPFADPSTRSFLVKVDLPAEKGLYPGMFGRLLVPVGEISLIWIPENALRRVGQLEMVTARTAQDKVNDLPGSLVFAILTVVGAFWPSHWNGARPWRCP